MDREIQLPKAARRRILREEEVLVIIAIDLKSFYASAEAADRSYDPLTTNLVVADESRTEKTICLAVSPSLKAYGIPGRARLFEVIRRVKEVNAERFHKARKLGLLPKDDDGKYHFTASSFDAVALALFSHSGTSSFPFIPLYSTSIRRLSASALVRYVSHFCFLFPSEFKYV